MRRQRSERDEGHASSRRARVKILVSLHSRAAPATRSRSLVRVPKRLAGPSRWHAITDDDGARTAVESRVMTRVQVSLRIPGTAPMPSLIRLIQGVEAAGFDGAGILDSQLLCRDTFVTMGLASAHTSTLTLFPDVTHPLQLHVTVL